MMTRRLVCLLLTLCLAVSLAQPVSAGLLTGPSHTPEPVTVSVWQGAPMQISAYRYHNDLLFSAEDLARLSGYTMRIHAGSISQGEITFTRGIKTLHIHIQAGGGAVLTAMNREQGVSVYCELIDGKYYLSASQMLSWLNMNCYVEDKMLCLVPTPVSYWDLFDEFRPDRLPVKFGFSMSECARLMLRSEKELEALAYMEKSFSGSVMDKITDGSWTQGQWYDLFADLIQDQSAADDAKNFFGICSEGLGISITLTEWIVKSVEDTVLEAVVEHFGIFWDATSALCSYALLFSQDNNTKLAMLDSLIRNYDGDEYTHMIMAARQAKQAYSEVWLGVMYTLGYDFFYEFAADYSCLTLLDHLDIDYIRSVAQGELMQRFAYYEQLSDMAYALYVKKVGNYSNIFDQEALAMLYLYGVEQRYRAMAQHVLDNDYIDDFIADSINVYADAAQEQYSRFLAASAYADFDSIDEDYRDDQAEKIRKLFDKVTVREPADSTAAALERGIFLTCLKESGMTDYRWDLVDLNGDGEKELLVFGRTDGISAPECMVLAGEKLGVFNFHAGGEGSAALYRDSGSGDYYVRYILDQDEFLEEYYVWRNDGWTKAASAHFDPIYENHESPTLEYEKTFSLNGAVSTESAYNAFAGKLKLVLQEFPGLSCPDLQDVTLSGDPASLMTKINDYLNGRQGYLRQESGDLNGDGKADRVYLLYNADDLYRYSAQRLYCSGSEYLLSDTTRRATLVAVLNAGSGIRLRCMNVNLPLEYLEEGFSLRFTDGYLKMADQYYAYQDFAGQPFTRDLADTSLGDRLYGRPYDEMNRDVSDENIWPGGGPFGGAYYDCDGYPTEVVYGKIYRGSETEIGVVEASFRECYPSVYELIPAIYPGMTTAAFLEYVNRVAKPTNPKIIQDPATDGKIALCHTCWYDADTGWYYLVSAYLSTTNGTLLFADAELMKKPPTNYLAEDYGIIPTKLTSGNLSEYFSLSYSQLKQQPWTTAYTALISDWENIWMYDCFLEGAHISFTLMGDFEDGDARPVSVGINDCAAGTPVTDTLIMGKTYGQLARDCALSELNDYGGGLYIAYGSAGNAALELVFLGDSPETAVLTEILGQIIQ